MEVLMPQLGETVTEGTISVWFKAAGDTIEKGENLFEIETDKVAMEVQATESGVLSEIRVSQGEVAPVGAIVAVIGGASQAASDTSADAKSDAQSGGSGPSKKTAAADTAPEASRGLASGAVPAASRAPAANGASRDVGGRKMELFSEIATPSVQFGSVNGPLGLKVTPLARRLARQRGIDLGAVARDVSARGGRRIHKADLEAAGGQEARGPAAPVAYEAPSVARLDGDTAEPFNRIRKQTARHLARSWATAPHVFQAVEVDFSRVDKVRKAVKADFAARTGVSLTYLPFIMRAVSVALKEFPKVNALIEGDGLVIRRNINIGVAVDLSHEGLVVPVIRDADGMTVAGLARAIDAMARKARDGKLEPSDLEGGSYSISNNGSFGTLFTAPIINGPQVAILSTDAVRKRPVVLETEDGDVIVSRPMGMVAQSFDHRAMDGAYSARFLGRVKEILETRDWAAELE
ncbi:dihydrolipoamide acetyltransferase family protein [Breoghania sp. L-A4]|uniref:dihydrolipoamide acetyltransferase family protein n=1 Tax=Breoghania sp. L-A4 TaxID=2304600 RepID=UPI0013C33304|nr:dihydrolipoamide acetyltransferase family protein [Breoghania sp. L-A4]